ncbi:MAG: Protein DipZ [Pseudomonas sp.]|nr:MAG: Protein DipZ [Pseudomonas sp.]
MPINTSLSRLRTWVRRTDSPTKLAIVAVLSLATALLAGLPKTADYLVNPARADSLDTPGDPMPPLDGAVQWLNSPPLTPEALKGKVVLVDFWTFDCINCRRSLPYVNAWAKKYAKDGLVVIGVHTPEYAFEKVIGNVRDQVKKLGIEYPVAIDNDYTIWHAFDNQYWPAHYFFDATGKERYSHFGEGRYDNQEKVIQALLEEAKAAHAPS